MFFSSLTGTGDKVPVSRNNILLSGCIIRNTDFVEGIVVYAGRFPPELKLFCTFANFTESLSLLPHPLNLNLEIFVTRKEKRDQGSERQLKLFDKAENDIITFVRLEYQFYLLS